MFFWFIVSCKKFFFLPPPFFPLLLLPLFLCSKFLPFRSFFYHHLQIHREYFFFSTPNILCLFFFGKLKSNCYYLFFHFKLASFYLFLLPVLLLQKPNSPFQKLIWNCTHKCPRFYLKLKYFNLVSYSNISLSDICL